MSNFRYYGSVETMDFSPLYIELHHWINVLRAIHAMHERVQIRQTCKNYVECGNEGQNSSIHAQEEQSYPYGMVAYHPASIQAV